MTTLQAILDPDELPAPKTDADISKRWVQVNVRFFSEPDGSSERIPWATLGSALANMRERNLFLWSFLTRKPPGMRLRFASDHIAVQLLPALVSWLERVEEDGIIRCYRFEHYEPEIHRFGGPDGMEIAHFAFDADTRLILSYYGNPSLRETLVPQIYSILTLDDLFSQATDDPAETWDIWKRLRGWCVLSIHQPSQESPLRGTPSNSVKKVVRCRRPNPCKTCFETSVPHTDRSQPLCERLGQQTD